MGEGGGAGITDEKKKQSEQAANKLRVFLAPSCKVLPGRPVEGCWGRRRLLYGFQIEILSDCVLARPVVYSPWRMYDLRRLQHAGWSARTWPSRRRVRVILCIINTAAVSFFFFFFRTRGLGSSSFAGWLVGLLRSGLGGVVVSSS
ncbi:hypothetical protein GQ53DRAFT_446208 [Thozetella sp. PMI_491]|nr:hypothetical protein GQ53DRAFT_446208 [Thozetella sp. PMI_491]